MFRFVWCLAVKGTPLQMQTRVWGAHASAAPIWTTWSTFRSRMYHFRQKHVTNMTASNPESQRRLSSTCTCTQMPPKKKLQGSHSSLSLGWKVVRTPRIINHQLPAERLHWQHRNPRLFARLLQLRKPLARNNCRNLVRKFKQNSIGKKLRSQRDPFSQRVAKSPRAIWLMCPSAWSTIRTIHLCHISRLQRIPKFRLLTSYTGKGALEGHKIVKRLDSEKRLD